MKDKPVAYPEHTRIYAATPRGWRLVGCVFAPRDRVIQAIRWQQRIDLRYHPLDPPSAPRVIAAAAVRVFSDDSVMLEGMTA